MSLLHFIQNVLTEDHLKCGIRRLILRATPVVFECKNGVLLGISKLDHFLVVVIERVDDSIVHVTRLQDVVQLIELMEKYVVQLLIIRSPKCADSVLFPSHKLRIAREIGKGGYQLMFILGWMTGGKVGEIDHR